MGDQAKNKERLSKVVREFELKCEHSVEEYENLLGVAVEMSQELTPEETKEALMDGIYGKGNWGSFKDTGPHWSDKPITDKSNHPG